MQVLPNLWVGGALLVTIAVALAAHFAVYELLVRIVRRRRSTGEKSIVLHTRRPSAYLIVSAILFMAAKTSTLAPDTRDFITHALVLCLIATSAWVLIALLHAMYDAIVARQELGTEDNLSARRIRTRLIFVYRIAIAFVATFAIAAGLMTFPEVRQFGQTVLASAGLLGLVAGLGARPVLSNLIAGLQISLTQPIRIDDVVVVENEWGRIESIESAYVVVRLWDERRLVLPLTYFIEQPFQNWTRSDARVLGTVLLYVDYGVPIEELRRELKRALDESGGLWDGRVWNLQVTDVTERNVQLRALMSASDSGKMWDLRCYVREALIRFLRANYPDSLPRVRTTFVPAAETSGGNGPDLRFAESQRESA